MRSASIGGSVPFGLHRFIVAHGVEHGREDATSARLAPQPVEHELRDGCVPDEVGPPEHLQVAGDCRLRQVENGLDVGHEKWRGRETVKNPQAGGLGDREQQIGRGTGDG
jgi:hypothetical protein